MSERAPLISIRDVTKRFGTEVTALEGVSLDIPAGEFFALLGPSGCGKTTLLRILAGFENPTAGEVLIDGEPMIGVSPNRRPLNMVFQNYAVFPHMSVAQNVAYGLKVTRVARGEIGERVAEALALVQLDGLDARKPGQLSGGQIQRVALARALVKRPKVLLLDEPLSALDAKLREQMQLELVRLQESVGITFVIVTHDQSEALSMADRVAVMDEGIIRQIAPPAELYEQPNCRFVADFIGKVNLFSGRVCGTREGRVLVEIAGFDAVPVPATGEAAGEVSVALRPEKVRLSASAEDAGPVGLSGKVREVAYYGDVSKIFLDNATGVIIAASLQNASRSVRPGVSVGDELWISWDPEDSLLLTE